MCVVAMLACGTNGLLAAPTPAIAEIINLECYNQAGGYENGGAYWVDFDKGMITHASLSNRRPVTASIMTVPVRITPEAVDFQLGGNVVNINRVTGVNSWRGPPAQMFNYSKGSIPLPATKF